MDKYEYLTGEDLGLKPSTIEQARFEYSPLGKIFNKGLSEDNKKEGLFKRLQNIEGKIKSENKRESEPIKNEEQSKIVKGESIVTDKKSKEIELLKDKLDLYLKILTKILIILEKILQSLSRMKKRLIIIICFFK